MDKNNQEAKQRDKTTTGLNSPSENPSGGHPCCKDSLEIEVFDPHSSPPTRKKKKQINNNNNWKNKIPIIYRMKNGLKKSEKNMTKIQKAD